MPTLTTHTDPPSAATSTLLVALDPGNTSWCLACAPAVSATPSMSGARRRELGIGKGGSAVLRGVAMELAWGWLRYQPTSALSQWYRRRFAAVASQSRPIGIVAVARRLMIDLWRFAETGRVPEGATLKA